ncbi:Lrp/AsnC family transcriptional regulator [Bacillus sp. 2205SS5-2]|uniref:Lrp/AsnC family transcriptional regulator n=1 Tax=Bacillus sp. 2205SS5-2 TaxID=3109031 RepID=UPI003007A5E3
MKCTEKELELLTILEQDARIADEVLAKMLNVTETEVTQMIESLKEQNVLVRCNALVNWSKVDSYEGITAMIDVKVTPKRGVGFNEIAQRIYRFPEVKSLYLMSGAYDLSVTVEGKSMNEVGNFVSQKLSTLDSVVSTMTHFYLKKYKHDGIILEDGEEDQRMVVSP